MINVNLQKGKKSKLGFEHNYFLIVQVIIAQERVDKTLHR